MRKFLWAVLVVCGVSSNARAVPMDSIPDAYRHFIMPTGKAISGGYFGFWELAFLQGGVGIADVASISAGFTVMPTVAFRSQFGFVQAKVTLVDEGGFSFATGANYLRLTSTYPYLHLFGVATVELPSKTRFTGLLMYKAYGEDYPRPDVEPYGVFSFSYGGALGAGIGMDMPLTGYPNIRFVAEAWNHDLTAPNKLAVIGALRVESDNFSSDFGFMVFTLPLAAPVANFVWRF